MSIFDAYLRGWRRVAAVGLLSVAATVSPGVANADCTGPHGQVSTSTRCLPTPAVVAQPSGSPPSADMQPATVRAFCEMTACFLIEDRPAAGVGGKT